MDDDLDETEEQTFVVRMRISSAVNQNSIVITREVAMVVIVDNDGKLAGGEGEEVILGYQRIIYFSFLWCICM